MNNYRLLEGSLRTGLFKGVVAGAVFGASLLIGAPQASATLIIGAVDVVDLSGAGDQGVGTEIGNIINQSGLSLGYVNGDDFDTYVGSVTHENSPNGNEWWTPYDTASAIIEFDLGAVYDLTHIALWNEDKGGLANVDVFVDDLGLVGSFNPTDNVAESPYGADVFEFASVVSGRYVSFAVVADEEDPNGSGFYTVSMGEVAFGVSEGAGEVPEPATVVLFGLGLAGLVGMTNRKKRLNS